MDDDYFFEYFGIHGWNENTIKKRNEFSQPKNIRNPLYTNETFNKYITNLKVIGKIIKEHLSTFKIGTNEYYKYKNSIDIPSFEFIPYTNETYVHNEIVQDIIDIAYEYEQDETSINDKLNKYQRNLNRGYKTEDFEFIMNKYNENIKIIKEKNNNLRKIEKELLNFSNIACDEIYETYNNKKKNVNLADNKLILNDILFNNENKTLLLSSNMITERYSGNKNLIVNPWIGLNNNMGHLSWNRMINKAAIGCILKNSKSLFNSLSLLQNNPQSLYYNNYYDIIEDDENSYIYLGFFLIRFNNQNDINLKKNFTNNTKEKYFVYFVLLNENKSLISEKYLLLNFKCNLVNWGGINDQRKYLQNELQQIMCMYNNTKNDNYKIYSYVLLPVINNTVEDINKICQSKHEEVLNINQQKQKNKYCIETWFNKSSYDLLRQNKIGLHTEYIKKEDFKDGQDLENDYKAIYFLTSKYNIDELYEELKIKNNIIKKTLNNPKNNYLYYRNIIQNKEYEKKEIIYLQVDDIDDKKYYLIEAYLKFENDFDNTKNERLLIDIIGQLKKEKNMCMDEEKNIIQKDFIRTNKLHSYYHDKSFNKLYDIEDIINKNYTNDLKEEKLKNNDNPLMISIINNTNVNNKINILCDNIWEFIKKLYNDNEKKICDIFKCFNVSYNIGQVETSYENIKEILKKDGNIREKATLLCNLYNKCDFIWDIIECKYENFEKYEKIKEYINEELLNKKIRTIEKIIGIEMKTIISDYKFYYKDNYNKKTLCYLPIKFSSVLRVNRELYPYLRKQKYTKNKIINEKNINPKLSLREKKYLKENNFMINNNNDIIWNTGQSVWKINDRSLYHKIAQKYNKKLISGYSGTAELLMECGLLFKSNINTMTLFSIGYMCYHLDHSMFEILTIAKQNGLIYNISDNDNSIIENLLLNIK